MNWTVCRFTNCTFSKKLNNVFLKQCVLFRTCLHFFSHSFRDSSRILKQAMKFPIPDKFKQAMPKTFYLLVTDSLNGDSNWEKAVTLLGGYSKECHWHIDNFLICRKRWRPRTRSWSRSRRRASTAAAGATAKRPTRSRPSLRPLPSEPLLRRYGLKSPHKEFFTTTRIISENRAARVWRCRLSSNHASIRLVEF